MRTITTLLLFLSILAQLTACATVPKGHASNAADPIRPEVLYYPGEVCIVPEEFWENGHRWCAEMLTADGSYVTDLVWNDLTQEWYIMVSPVYRP